MSLLNKCISGLTEECQQKTLFNTIWNKMMQEENLFNHPLQEELLGFLQALDDPLYKAKSNSEGCKFVDKCFRKKYFAKLDDMVTWMKKHEFIAGSLYKKCYGYFNFDLAMRCCNLALAFTPSHEKELMASLYADRGRFLLVKKKWNPARIDAIKSISNLRTSEGEGLIPAVTEAKLINSTHESMNWELYRHWKKERPEIEIQRIYRNNLLFKLLTEPNAKILCAANFVTIARHGVEGRILIVNQDVKAGTTVAVEDPYVSMLRKTLRWDLNHCGRCYTESFSLTPCGGCAFVSYCSEKCRKEDFDSGHKYECKCIPYLHAIDLPFALHLGFRAVCKAGPNYMYNLFRQSIYDRLKKLKCENQDDVKGFDPESGIYASDSYFQIYNLKSSQKRLGIDTWFAYVLAKLLEGKTDFFINIKSRTERKDFVLFVESTFVYHANSIPLNIMPVWKPNKFNTKFLRRNRPKEDTPYVYALYSVISLAGHSSDPSALPVTQANGKLALVTIRDLKAGEELTISFRYKYSTEKSSIRISGLKERYVFPNVPAVAGELWPNVEQMRYLLANLEFLCPDCRVEYCVLRQKNAAKMMCQICDNEFGKRQIKNEVRNFLVKLKSARKLVFQRNPVAAVQILLECIQFFQARIKSPSRPLINSQYTLRLALEAIARTE